MKKIINGKVYNTETANEVGDWWNGYGRNDFSHCNEKLYLKKTGEFFIYGEGGPMSMYAKRVGTSSTGGEDITPLSYAEAKEWAETNLDAEEYENIFGEVVEDESRVTISISISVTTQEKLKRISQKKGVSVSEIIENLVNDFETNQ